MDITILSKKMTTISKIYLWRLCAKLLNVGKKIQSKLHTSRNVMKKSRTSGIKVDFCVDFQVCRSERFGRRWEIFPQRRSRTTLGQISQLRSRYRTVWAPSFRFMFCCCTILINVPVIIIFFKYEKKFGRRWQPRRHWAMPKN